MIIMSFEEDVGEAELNLTIREVQILSDLLEISAERCCLPIYQNELKAIATKFSNLERNLHK